MKLFILSNGLGYGLLNREIFKAWNEASGMGKYSKNPFFRDGVFHVTISSSLVRNQLSFQRELIMQKMNQLLDESETVQMTGLQDRVSKIVMH